MHSPAKGKSPMVGTPPYQCSGQKEIPASRTPGFDLPVNNNVALKFKGNGIILGKCYGM